MWTLQAFWPLASTFMNATQALRMEFFDIFGWKSTILMIAKNSRGQRAHKSLPTHCFLGTVSQQNHRFPMPPCRDVFISLYISFSIYIYIYLSIVIFFWHMYIYIYVSLCICRVRRWNASACQINRWASLTNSVQGLRVQCSELQGRSAWAQERKNDCGVCARGWDLVSGPRAPRDTGTRHVGDLGDPVKQWIWRIGLGCWRMCEPAARIKHRWRPILRVLFYSHQPMPHGK